MKPSGPSNKGSSSNSKSKKSSKDREKRKSQGGTIEVNNHSVTEKGSPTKDSARLYAGIDAESIITYAEQSSVEHLPEEITNTLTEDINYKLRYIINDSLIKARLSGRNAITSKDLDHTFENLRLDKVYGAPAQPEWVTFSDQNLCCLDDKIVNLVELAEEENVYYQYSEPILTTKWLPEQDEISAPLRNYFAAACQMIVSSDITLRRMALSNISENNRIGPIIEWFYNFGYILLSRDITYDCLTLRALDLITVLENSPTCRINVSEKQLKLLVRLILQRLLKSVVANELLKPICRTLALLCVRDPLKEFVILKILQKMNEIFQNYALSVITTANCLGIEAIQSLVLPDLDLFLSRIAEKKEMGLTYSILESYYIICREKLINSCIYESFYEHFGDAMTIFNETVDTKNKQVVRKDINLVRVKCDLLRTRRKICARENIINNSPNIEEIFELPPENSRIRKKMEGQKWEGSNRETSVTVGKTSLLLPVFNQKHTKYVKCHDHTLIWYNL